MEQSSFEDEEIVELFSEPFLTSGKFSDGVSLLKKTGDMLSKIAGEEIQKCCDDDDTEGAIEWIELAVMLRQISLLMSQL